MPVPQRSEERVTPLSERESAAISRAPLELEEPLGPEAPAWMDEFTAWIYDQFRYSGQARYYAPSDWAAIITLCRFGLMPLKRKPSAMMLQTVMRSMESLGATEAGRRAMKIELDAYGEAIDPEKDAALQEAQNWATVYNIVPPMIG